MKVVEGNVLEPRRSLTLLHYKIKSPILKERHRTEMNRKEHLFIGIVIFFVYNFINNSLINYIINPIFGLSDIGLWLVGAFAAALGSVIPDQIEPATHWTHRNKFHSKKTLNLLMWFFAITAVISLFSSLFFYISCFFLGYVFHLLADSITEVGLPDN